MKKITLLLFSFLVIKYASSQDVGFILTYPMGFSVGDMDNYISKTSFRGISGELYKRIKPNLDIGIEASWSLFYEKTGRQTVTEGTASINGVQFRYVHVVPLLAQAKYFLKPESGKRIIPYGGLGVGTMYVDKYTDLGLYRIRTDVWQFCVRPEAGIAIQTKHMPDIVAGVKYYAGFETADLKGQSYFSVNVGVMFSGFY